MSKVVNIVETKIMQRNGVDVQRVIFSNDKIVYVRLDDGTVYPASTPDHYVDLISMYNASHTITGCSEYNMNDERRTLFDEEPRDRQEQISETDPKNFLSLTKNKNVQKAIISITGFGKIAFVGGILQSVIIPAIIIVAMILQYGSINNDSGEWILINAFVDFVVGLVFMIMGSKIKVLDMTPGGIKGCAITTIILSIVCLLSGGFLGLIGILTLIEAIVTLTKVRVYEDWYYWRIK